MTNPGLGWIHWPLFKTLVLCAFTATSFITVLVPQQPLCICHRNFMLCDVLTNGPWISDAILSGSAQIMARQPVAPTKVTSFRQPMSTLRAFVLSRQQHFCSTYLRQLPHRAHATLMIVLAHPVQAYVGKTFAVLILGHYLIQTNSV